LLQTATLTTLSNKMPQIISISHERCQKTSSHQNTSNKLRMNWITIIQVKTTQTKSLVPTKLNTTKIQKTLWTSNLTKLKTELMKETQNCTSTWI
jgi:hypothetical protein